MKCECMYSYITKQQEIDRLDCDDDITICISFDNYCEKGYTEPNKLINPMIRV